MSYREDVCKSKFNVGKCEVGRIEYKNIQVKYWIKQQENQKENKRGMRSRGLI